MEGCTWKENERLRAKGTQKAVRVSAGLISMPTHLGHANSPGVLSFENKKSINPDHFFSISIVAHLFELSPIKTRFFVTNFLSEKVFPPFSVSPSPSLSFFLFFFFSFSFFLFLPLLLFIHSSRIRLSSEMIQTVFFLTTKRTVAVWIYVVRNWRKNLKEIAVRNVKGCIKRLKKKWVRQERKKREKFKYKLRKQKKRDKWENKWEKQNRVLIFVRNVIHISKENKHK